MFAKEIISNLHKAFSSLRFWPSKVFADYFSLLCSNDPNGERALKSLELEKNTRTPRVWDPD